MPSHQVAMAYRMQIVFATQRWLNRFSGGVLPHIQKEHPGFGYDAKYSGLPRRFKRRIFARISWNRDFDTRTSDQRVRHPFSTSP
jgi:hypothetical protein